MESIISVLTETTGAWESTLLQWCEENKDIWNIAGKYGSAAKETFVGLLCERLMALPAEETTPLLLALRLCLRDPAGLGPVLRNPALTTKVATIAGICGCSGKPNADALRVVVNLISKSPQAKATLVEACKACEGVTRLISVTDPADRDSLFLLYRIAVNLSIANEKVAAALRKDDALYRSVERDVVPLIPLVAAGDPRLFAPPMATEALKLLFSLTMHAGPLASAAATTPLSEHEKRGLAVLFPFFDVVLSLRDRAAAAGVCPGWYELKVAVIDCLLNLPKEELPTLVPKEVLMKTVDNLLFCASEAVDDEHKMSHTHIHTHTHKQTLTTPNIKKKKNQAITFCFVHFSCSIVSFSFFFFRHAELLVPVLMLLMGVMIYTPGSTAYIFEKCFPAEEFGSVDPHSSEYNNKQLHFFNTITFFLKEDHH